MACPQTFKISLAQLDPVIGDLSYNLELLRKAWVQADIQGSQLLILPELFLGGYTGLDIVMNPDFQKNLEKAIDALVEESQHHSVALLLGSALYNAHTACYENGFMLIDQGKIIARGTKEYLANDSVFEEKRHFSPKKEKSHQTFLWRGVALGVLVCNDIWFSKPIEEITKAGAEIIIVINASPFEDGKQAKRHLRVAEQAKKSSAPIIYLNQVGGQDEVVFDGGSFIMNKDGQYAMQMDFFEMAVDQAILTKEDGGWICKDGKKALLGCSSQMLYEAAVAGLYGYINKNNFSSLILGLSGGIDSALCAAIAVDAVGAENLAVYAMPSPFSSKASLEDASALAKNLGVELCCLPISEVMQAVSQGLQPALGEPLTMEDGIAFENMQARLRGLFLMTIANKKGSLLLATSNKSESATGYSTLYGDQCGGFAPLADLYKTHIYLLSHWRNTHHPRKGKGPTGSIIPQAILEKAPSAELRPDQKDQDSLPPYDQLDAILHGLIEKNQSQEDIQRSGFDKAMIHDIAVMVERSEYKRRQAPPGLKLSPRAFTTERRYPLTTHLYTPLKKD